MVLESSRLDTYGIKHFTRAQILDLLGIIWNTWRQDIEKMDFELYQTIEKTYTVFYTKEVI